MLKIEQPEKLEKPILIRLTKEEKKILEELAKKYKCPMNLIVRHAIQQIHEAEQNET